MAQKSSVPWSTSLSMRKPQENIRSIWQLEQLSFNASPNKHWIELSLTRAESSNVHLKQVN